MILDREDVEQEAIVGLWRALPNLDPSSSSLGTFIERVMASRVTSGLPLQHAAKRKPIFFDMPGLMKGYSQRFQIVIGTLLVLRLITSLVLWLVGKGNYAWWKTSWIRAKSHTDRPRRPGKTLHVALH